MISRKCLFEDTLLTSVKCRVDGEYSIDMLKIAIEKACADFALNVIVSVDTITSGRLFDDSKTECITITNAEHQSDYYTEVIAMKKQGVFAFFDFYYTGISKNNSRVAEGKREHSTMLGSLVGAIKKASVTNDAMETETNYYDMLCEAIRTVLGQGEKQCQDAENVTETDIFYVPYAREQRRTREIIRTIVATATEKVIQSAVPAAEAETTRLTNKGELYGV